MKVEGCCDSFRNMRRFNLLQPAETPSDIWYSTDIRLLQVPWLQGMPTRVTILPFIRRIGSRYELYLLHRVLPVSGL